jgi:hypothetical protein
MTIAPEWCRVRCLTILSGAHRHDPFAVYARIGSLAPFWTDNPIDVDGFGG